MPKTIGRLLLQIVPTAIGFLVGGPLGAAIAAVGASYLSKALFGQRMPKPSDGQQTTREAIGSRRRHYGIVHTSGQLTFFDSADGTLGQVVTLGTGLEHEILEHRINDNVVTVAAGTVTEERYKGAIHIYTRSGDADQTAIGELTASFPAWTSDHRQRGCAHAAIICDPVDQEDFSEVFAGQIPQYSQVRKGAAPYDPRKDSTAVIFDDGEGFTVNGTGPQRVDDPATWLWSDNWALVTADYFAHADGFGGGYENVNWTNIATEADICDQQVATRDGSQIDRWRAWASYTLARDERRTVLGNFLKAADGFCWQDASGKFNLLAGRYLAPTVTITDDHILGMTATKGPSSDRRVSAAKVAYTEASIGYREQESATIDNPDVPDDPHSDPQLFDIYFAPHHNQAARLGKIIVYQLGDRWYLDALLNLYGLNLLGQRFCRLESAQLGISIDCKIEGAPKLDLARMQVRVQLAEIEEEDWNFDAATEEGVPPGSATTGGGDRTIAVPTGLALSAVALSFGDANGVAISATWDDPGRKGLTYEAQLRETPAGEWVTMVVDDANFSARSGPVNSGVEHEVRVRARSIGGRTSAWSATVAITPTAATSVPAPSSLTADPGAAGEAVIGWRNPQAAFDHVKLLTNTADDLGTATQIGGEFTGSLGELKTHTETGLAAGTHYFWARAYDAADNPSAATGPVTAVVT